MADLVRRHARVTGRVQGVSFRYHTTRQAHRLGVTGWVRNLPDGAVELEVQGPAGAVGELLSWVEDGPPDARVVRVVVDDADAVEGERDFVVTG